MKKHFTLLELSLSVGLLAVTLTVGGMALNGARQSWSKTTQHDKQLKRLQTIDSVVDNAFRNAIVFTWPERNKEVLCFAGESDFIMLPYLHRVGNRKDGAIRFIKIYVKQGVLYAAYRSTPVTAPMAESYIDFTVEPLADNVRKVTFYYGDYDKKQLKWFDRWDNAKQKNLPVAIQMELEFTDNSRQVWLRRTAGNSFYTQIGDRKAATP